MPLAIIENSDLQHVRETPPFGGSDLLQGNLHSRGQPDGEHCGFFGIVGNRHVLRFGCYAQYRGKAAAQGKRLAETASGRGWISSTC